MTVIKKKAVVIGATGLVGLALVERLQQAPEFEAITVVVRKESQIFNTYDKVTQLVVDDLLMLNDEDVNDHTHAFSCLGTTLKVAGSKQGFLRGRL